MPGKGPRLTDKFNELKKKMGKLKSTYSIYRGSLEEKKKNREQCYKNLRELGVKNPEDPEKRKAHIRKRKQDLLRAIELKAKEVDDVASRFDEVADDSE